MELHTTTGNASLDPMLLVLQRLPKLRALAWSVTFQPSNMGVPLALLPGLTGLEISTGAGSRSDCVAVLTALRALTALQSFTGHTDGMVLPFAVYPGQVTRLRLDLPWPHLTALHLSGTFTCFLPRMLPPSVRTLRLSRGKCISDSTLAEALAAAPRPHLSTVELGGAVLQASDGGAEALGRAVASLPVLASLALGCTPHVESSWPAFAAALAPGATAQLTSLSVHVPSDAVAAGVSQLLCHVPRLAKLSLTVNTCDSAMPLVRQLAELPMLGALRVSVLPLDSSRSIPDSRFELWDSGSEPLQDSHAARGLTRLEFLSSHDQPEDAVAEFAALAAALPTLRELRFDALAVSAAAAAALAEALAACAQLTRLTVSVYDAVDGAAAAALARLRVALPSVSMDLPALQNWAV